MSLFRKIWCCLIVFSPGTLLYAIPPAFPDLHSSWVDSVYQSLDEDQRIAQLMMIPAYSNENESHNQRIADLIEKYNVGGLIFFQGGPGRQARLTHRFQALARTPLLIGIDGEWGLAMRLDSISRFPRQMMLGAIQNDSLLFRLGKEMARQFRALGIHLNFAPVADVNNNPRNPVINSRSFGENPSNVARQASVLMLGMQAGGLLTTAKHFPGHGDTETDSHEALPVIRHPRNRLDSVELYPFRKMIEEGVTGIMIGHLHVTALDSTPGAAASISPAIVTGILRHTLNFKGLICTDALNMKGITGSGKNAAVEALRAGVNLLLMPENFEQAMIAIKKALLNGSLDPGLVEYSCRMVLSAKEKAGLSQNNVTLRAQNPVKELEGFETESLRHLLSEASLTLVRNQDSIVPLRDPEMTKTAVLLAGSAGANAFSERIKDYDRPDVFYLAPGSHPSEALLQRLKSYDRVILGIHNTNFSSQGRYGVSQTIVAFSESLAEETDVVLVVFASPYALALFKKAPSFKAILVAYEDTDLNGDYAAQLLYGGIPALGKLPVSAGLFFTEGTGLSTRGSLRLSYTVPMNVGIHPKSLYAIDSLANEGIRQKAFPGCQVMAAKNGRVFFRKNYGYTQYAGGEPVRDSTLYDLASLTKILGTTPAVMFLQDQGKLDIDNKITTYLPELIHTNKKNITLKEILAHQAGLQASVVYYPNILEPLDSTEKLFNAYPGGNYSVRLDSRYWGNANIRYKPGLLRTRFSGFFPYRVADRLFASEACRDTLMQLIHQTSLLSKRYLYSDLGFIYLWKIVERITQEPMNEYLNKRLYAPLGIGSLGYLPLDRFSREQIAPTEQDRFFRKQLVQGTVHDPVAALMGGVSGHAGLFSSANEVVKIMQLFLNGGIYGGKRFFSESVLERFTSNPYYHQNRNRRGLGFDKPAPGSTPDGTCEDCVSDKSFGHSGFTGTYTWADPSSGLVYVFLSNRVYPEASNGKLSALNTRIQMLEVFSKSIQEEGYCSN